MTSTQPGMIVPDDLSPERGLLFRITHIKNLPWLLDHGIPCANGQTDPDFVAIGNSGLIDRRANWPVPLSPGGTLAEYVPFYFTPKSPMLLNILTGRGVERRSPSDIVVLVTAIPFLIAKGATVLFTDRHALLRTAQFSEDPLKLTTLIKWDNLRRADFKRSPNDPEKVDRYMAEALVHGHVPVTALIGIGCDSCATKRFLETVVQNARLALRIATRPGWYFQ